MITKIVITEIVKWVRTMRVLMGKPAGPVSSSTSRTRRDTSCSFVVDSTAHALSVEFRHEPQFTCPSEYWRQQATAPSVVFPCPSSSSSSGDGECARLANASSMSDIDTFKDRVKIVVSIWSSSRRITLAWISRPKLLVLTGLFAVPVDFDACRPGPSDVELEVYLRFGVINRFLGLNQ